jgi:hypothetical protein
VTYVWRCETLETYGCNILNIQIKHLQYTFEVDETFETYTCNIRVLSLQHMKHIDKTLATYVWNRWNIWNIQLQYTCIANTTYAISRWNTCNTRWNIHLKRIKTYGARCHRTTKKFRPALSCQRSIVMEAANGACRCGPALLSQTGKRPGQPCN